jgi:uncharacterized YigZ family protein
MTPYTTVKKTAAAELVQKRSRFIGVIAPVKTPEEAAAFVANQKQRHFDARHTVWAYRLRAGEERCSDDGEPQGTAGQPVLEVVRREGLTDVCVAVTRYFGGILLGAGGLVRAYSSCASLAVANAEPAHMQPCTVFALRMAYAQYGLIQSLLEKSGARVLESDFLEEIMLRVLVADAKSEEFLYSIAQASAATIVPQVCGRVFDCAQ